MTDISTMPESPEILDIVTALERVKPEDLSFGRWAEQAGLARNYFTGLRKHRNPNSDAVAKLLQVIQMDPVRFEQMRVPVHSEVAGVTPLTRDVSRSFGEFPTRRDLPVYGTAIGGEYGDIDTDIELVEMRAADAINWVHRPQMLELDRTAYAVEIVGESMTPRFRPGECVAVSPRASVGLGDDVIVQLKGQVGDDELVKIVLIKELVRVGSDYYELRQYEPKKTFRVEKARVAKLHKVVCNLF